jgi:hypothetical protein
MGFRNIFGFIARYLMCCVKAPSEESGPSESSVSVESIIYYAKRETVLVIDTLEPEKLPALPFPYPKNLSNLKLFRLSLSTIYEQCEEESSSLSSDDSTGSASSSETDGSEYDGIFLMTNSEFKELLGIF